MSATVLILDDEPWQLSWLDDIAHTYGAVCKYAATYSEAVAAFMAEEPVLVIVDVRIGEVDESPKGATLSAADPAWIGLRFIRLIRVERKAKTPVFVYTGLDREDIRVIVEDAFQGSFFTKFEPLRFRRAVIAKLQNLKSGS